MPSAADRAVPQPSAPAAGVAAFVAERARTPGFALSAALHGTLLVAVLLSPAARHLVSFPALEVSVDILTPDEFAREIDRSAARPSEATPKSEPGGLPQQDAPVETPSTVHPATMLSARALADPRSSKAVAALRTLAGGERMVQLCNLEAMEQIHAWRDRIRPAQIVAYATRSVRFVGTTVVADGAAFRAGDGWSNLRYICELASGGDVVDFEFMVGDAIGRDRWEELGLPSGPPAD